MSASPPLVLIVDDEEPLLRLMARLVEKSGYRVLSATTGAEARRLFREHGDQIELALLDVTMPGGDGAEALLPEFLAERPGLSVVVTSGEDPPEALRTEIERVGGDFLRKPFASRALRSLLEEQIATGQRTTTLSGQR
jgi:DNA-binding NtrC family response regulator